MQHRHMDKHIKLSLGTLYHVVEQLQGLGWVRSTETAREGRRPEKTIYAVTPEGHERFLQRLRELIAEPNQEYSSFEAGLSFLHQLSPAEAADLLRQRATALRHQMESWDCTRERLHEMGLMRLALIEAEMVQDLRRFQAEWAARIADEIESGALEWRTHVPPTPTLPLNGAGGAEQEIPT